MEYQILGVGLWLGVVLIAAGLGFMLLLGSYSADDPGWMVATDEPAQNLLGRFGAAVASTLMIIVGKGAWAIPVILLAWGVRYVVHRGTDRVLGLAIAEWLHELGTGDEGRLSQRLNALVSRTTCAAIAREIELGPHMLLGKQANDDGARDSDNVLGDVMEALIGACFVTHGYAAGRAMVRKLWQGPVTGQTGSAKHPKSALQEWSAAGKRRSPVYRLIDRAGPDHAARFTVAVEVHAVGSAQGSGSSKQEAETAAAAAFLEQFA